ncbi:MAG TPA: hypothetical protein VM680_16490, partial [Verrucomicrobiae bacterium]|nr:hypothetical protein [Verrucomicrobiae bacterium]
MNTFMESAGKPSPSGSVSRADKDFILPFDPCALGRPQSAERQERIHSNQVLLLAGNVFQDFGDFSGIVKMCFEIFGFDFDTIGRIVPSEVSFAFGPKEEHPDKSIVLPTGVSIAHRQ